MSKPHYFVLGDYNAACFECGRRFKASTLKKHWRGYYVCPEHWEPRDPQEFVGTPRRPEAPPWVQLQEDLFVDTPTTPWVPPIR
ncbi:MAG: hypothetical protein DDT42_01988 [candidate division WS2 bacterium]|uniref:C2H2-type domain-containing protein n=1 Tax=Psychracetigena formicireducens TaxID=2986056 RepID=A0A9E2BIB1_PSYF1|nr:hypothetical protein [Candidatus Psychracetigena formicireducens]